MGVTANLQTADPAASPPIMARLFSATGRMMVTVVDLSDDMAVATTDSPPPTGSIAVVARNCVRLPATVAAIEGGRFTLTLDEPLDGRRREQFVGLKPAATHRRPDVAAAA